MAGGAGFEPAINVRVKAERDNRYTIPLYKIKSLLLLFVNWSARQELNLQNVGLQTTALIVPPRTLLIKNGSETRFCP